jgi:hypothetical protein
MALQFIERSLEFTRPKGTHLRRQRVLKPLLSVTAAGLGIAGSSGVI